MLFILWESENPSSVQHVHRPSHPSQGISMPECRRRPSSASRIYVSSGLGGFWVGHGPRRLLNGPSLKPQNLWSSATQ
ncbi:uncharacterized protein BDCG_16426 [Blastomyces dermatitidis ER-3]|uniref:Uncharacterized protein n=1 Tax=Ajellomyces dermatitidis (strain ER-3 / ATCC MYA-2586) TaxID=559297 RepID=A0ABX2VS15_AJEDR|nr:uncharacterized protein BDCG_16426 [Blastomyces dermatitidis ER-3]OAT00014.1 hypothetical protein BDCG_16426 [Blastomyces dermatitidis ER-3]